VVTAETKAEMKRILDDIQSGRFVRDFMHENAVGAPSFKATRSAARNTRSRTWASACAP
jgi:ketol-acid reductoisomerase